MEPADVGALARRYGADEVEPITMGMSGAQVHRLARPDRVALFLKQGSESEIAGEAARFRWLRQAGYGCPEVVDAGPGWVLTTELAGRDVAQDWPPAVHDRVLDAFADAMLGLHALDAGTCPFPTRYPDHDLTRSVVVTHGDFCCPNVLVDPVTFEVTGVVDVGWLGVGDAYVDVATTVMTLGGDLNVQYGGARAVERVLGRVGADPEDPRVRDYLAFYRTG